MKGSRLVFSIYGNKIIKFILNINSHEYTTSYRGFNLNLLHGFNLNLRGIDILTKEIKFALKTNNDIGSSRVLNSYQTKFRRITIPIYLATNSIVKLYTNQSFPAKIARKTVLRLGNVIWPIKNAIIDKLLIKNT